MQGKIKQYLLKYLVSVAIPSAMVDTSEYMVTSLLLNNLSYRLQDKGKILVIKKQLARDKSFVGYK